MIDTGENNSIKITFTGDIMCNMIEILAHENNKDHCDFSEKFSKCEEYLKKSDFL
jgi:hypothetical protein